MSASISTREDIEYLYQVLDVPLLCDLTTDDCVISVEWSADGECPRCAMLVFDRHLCAACYMFVNDGNTMRHSKCGFIGSSSLFYFNFRKI